MTIVLDQNGNPVEAGNVAGELISLRSENAKLKAELEQWQRSVCEQGEVIENLKAELAALKAEVESWKTGAIHRDRCFHSAQDEISALKAELAAETKKFEAAITTNERLLSDVRCANYELAAAQKDAERYRWATEHLRIGEFNNTTDDSNGFQDYSDEAIDAAMEAK